MARVALNLPNCIVIWKTFWIESISEIDSEDQQNTETIANRPTHKALQVGLLKRDDNWAIILFTSIKSVTQLNIIGNKYLMGICEERNCGNFF